MPFPKLEASEIPSYGSLALPEEGEEEGASRGLSLDQAIERLVHHNLDLRMQSFEIPQAQADVLTAGLRANPLLYADTALIPYGSYSDKRPGGPTQYDVSLTLPFDLNHKRKARIDVACRAKRVLEAQYQDAVRLQIDNLHTAYVDLLAARATVAYARASIEGLEGVLEEVVQEQKEGRKSESDVSLTRAQLEAARIGRRDAEVAVLKAKSSLGTLLNIPAEALEIQGTIRDTAPPAPTEEVLFRTALEARPDLAAYRLGVGRAEADVKLARANRYSDVYLTATPFTYQDISPFHAKSATSWSVGLTVPLPISNRNQGNIERARLNVSQTRTGLVALQQRVLSDVRRASLEYQISRDAAGQMERDLVPASGRVMERRRDLYRKGEIDALEFLDARRDYNDTIRQYRDALVRHRRSMLDLNTAVGVRLLP